MNFSIELVTDNHQFITWVGTAERFSRSEVKGHGHRSNAIFRPRDNCQLKVLHPVVCCPSVSIFHVRPYLYMYSMERF